MNLAKPRCRLHVTRLSEAQRPLRAEGHQALQDFGVGDSVGLGGFRDVLWRREDQVSRVPGFQR